MDDETCEILPKKCKIVWIVLIFTQSILENLQVSKRENSTGSCKPMKFEGVSASCTWNDKSLQGRTLALLHGRLTSKRNIPISCLKVIRMLASNRFEPSNRRYEGGGGKEQPLPRCRCSCNFKLWSYLGNKWNRDKFRQKLSLSLLHRNKISSWTSSRTNASGFVA